MKRHRVSHILQAFRLGPDLSMVDPDALEAGRRRGQAVHAALEALHYGFDYDISPGDEGYLDAYKSFCVQSQHEAVASEFEVVHPELHYVGHPDRLGWLQGVRMILDWKTGHCDLRYAALQLAAYRLAWNASHPTQLVQSVAVVELRKEGTFRFHEIEMAEPERVFLSALTVFQFMQRDHGSV